ncbi:40S ribosomal protein S5-1 [Hordeum vulgare]|nr:40S ribosomal protein S5-1 [Hordeum vulgare]
MLHIRDVEGPKKTGSVETRLEAMEQQVFKCQGVVERGLNANHMMITEFSNNHKMDAIDIGKHLSRLYDRVDQFHGQIYDLQNQNCSIVLHADAAGHLEQIDSLAPRQKIKFGSLEYAADAQGDLFLFGFTASPDESGHSEALTSGLLLDAIF